MDDTGLKTQFVEPVEICGKTFEQSDVEAVVRETIKILKRGFNKPKSTKSRHAKFVLKCVDLGLASVGHSDMRLINLLAAE